MGGIGESSSNPQESGTLDAALGIGSSNFNTNATYDLGLNGEQCFYGKCAVEVLINLNLKMTESQKSLVEHFNHLNNINPGFLEDQDRTKLADLFKFRGLLGQGSFGVVLAVEDKFRGDL